jgi:hypothetical protein
MRFKQFKELRKNHNILSKSFMEKALNNNFVILGIRKLGENMNKEAILYIMNAREKVGAERK